ncbi:hypothetical protein AVEN_185506-1 [Araneus ventricosus]|uniref:Uncharacterized protein n=1 Tax=Araneus ventricosus TaxID=182803 RepID=A0A4Y2G8F0_ARAVE|nr:hypothetical protein AVEN_185506-1 [Araneus ventricosus]
MSFSKKLPCGLCSKKVFIEDENFPEDLYDLLLKYSIPRLYWICRSCDKEYFDNDHGEIFNLKDEMKLLKTRVQTLEFDMSKITGRTRYKAPDFESDCEAVNLEESSSEVSGVFTSDSGYQDSLSDCHSSPISTSNGRAPSSPTSSGSCSRTPNSIDRNFVLEDASPKKSCKEALAILDQILKTKIKIDAKESEKSSNTVTNFLNDITPAFKKDVVFRSMYSRDYKTGSSYNELRISEASEYDIQIVLKAPPQIRLEVEFFQETMTFAKLKWRKISDFPSSKLDVLNFFEKNSENGYLKPLKISAWFQGLIDVYLKSSPKIPGIRKMRNSQSGPARTIEVETDEGYKLSIDLLLAFTFPYDCLMGTEINNILEKYPVDKSKKFWFLVPKLCQGEVPLLASDCAFSWRVNFPEVERKVLYNKLCAKNVVKLLKLLRDKENWQIASHHLKTLILWAIDANPKTNYWQGTFLFDRYLETLASLQKCLEDRHLPCFMDVSYNLFHELNKDECRNVSNRLKHIIKLIKSDYNYLNSIYA